MSDKYYQYGKEDCKSPAPSNDKDMSDAPGEKLLKDPGSSKSSHDSSECNYVDDLPKMKESGKME